MMQYIYLIECQGRYKIGVAGDIQSRLAGLQTGNPFPLTVMACFGYLNAEVVEKAIHQRFSNERIRGEWFSLDDQGITEFLNICRILGGEESYLSNASPLQDEIEEAEEIQEAVFEGNKFDYAQMYADGWTIDPFNDKQGNKRYWGWRRRRKYGVGYIYGGLLKDLPYPLEEMRRIYRDEVK